MKGQHNTKQVWFRIPEEVSQGAFWPAVRRKNSYHGSTLKFLSVISGFSSKVQGDFNPMGERFETCNEPSRNNVKTFYGWEDGEEGRILSDDHIDRVEIK